MRNKNNYKIKEKIHQSFLRYDNRVVVITGAGSGIGKEYALLFASRGAKVVVNDLGTRVCGEKTQNVRHPADIVVEEIVKNGGEAIANYNSVEEGEKIIEAAISKWGRVDVLINNAGILRDKSFLKMTESDWDSVYRIHLKGAYITTRAAWKYMWKSKYGRIVFTSSASGLYGNFGQSNYSASKGGLIGLSQCLSYEGKDKNIFCNVIAPVAGTRMTATVKNSNRYDQLKSEHIPPLLVWLCHETCSVSGRIFQVGGGWIGEVRTQISKGIFLAPKKLTPETIHQEIEKISDFSKGFHPKHWGESFVHIMESRL